MHHSVLSTEYLPECSGQLLSVDTYPQAGPSVSEPHFRRPPCCLCSPNVPRMCCQPSTRRNCCPEQLFHSPSSLLCRPRNSGWLSLRCSQSDSSLMHWLDDTNRFGYLGVKWPNWAYKHSSMDRHTFLVLPLSWISILQLQHPNRHHKVLSP